MPTSTPSHDGRPDNSWNLEKLEGYALDRANEIHGIGRKTITQSWLFGESLSLIRDLTKQNKSWVDWVKTQPFSLTTATNAIKLFERVTFEELQSFQGMTPTDLKAAFDIIKAPAPKRRSKMSSKSTSEQATNQPNEAFLKLVKDESGSSDEGAVEQAEGDPSEQQKDETTGSPSEAADRKVTTTDYSRSTRRKTAESEVGPALTTSEVLGQALNLLLQAERDGVTADCSEILTSLAAKVAALLETVNAVTA